MTSSPVSVTSQRTAELLSEQREKHRRAIDRLFERVLLGEWLLVSAGRVAFGPHGAWGLLAVGTALSAAPIFLSRFRPAHRLVPLAMTSAQILWSALFVHLTGGRPEAELHLFASLALTALYRDWAVLLGGAAIAIVDIFARGVLFPASFGGGEPVWWRPLEYLAWVLLEAGALALGCLGSSRESRMNAQHQAAAELLSESERRKTDALNSALKHLKASHDQLVRTEKLATVGQLAASMSHELRNPLAAVRNAGTFVKKKLTVLAAKSEVPVDGKVLEFLDVIDREAVVCTRIISDLLDFARERTPNLQTWPLRPLVDEAISLVPKDEASPVEVVNDIPEDLPLPSIDREQVRQVFVNLVSNAIEAIGDKAGGRVRITGAGGGETPWRITVEDNGPGMNSDVLGKVFEPLFTTKTKGTGLGLAIVNNMVARHKGTVFVESEPGLGTKFIIELPKNDRRAA